MLKTGKFILFLWLMTLVNSAHAAKPIQVKATVDRNEMGVGDTFTYTVEVSSDQSVNVADPRLPELHGLELINSWSGVESRSTFANGSFEVVQSRNFNYMLSATKSGTYTLGATTVIVEGKTYTTQPITIRVLEGRPQARQGKGQRPPADDFEDMDDIFNQLLKRHFGGGGGTRTQPVNPDEAFFIQVQLDKEKAYVGEQITASWYLYTRGQIHDIDTLQYPELNGFWKEEIELATRLEFQQEVVNGIVYQRALLASYALFPIKPGKATIDPYKAKCTVSVPASFGFSRPYQFTKASRPISIEVQDIPKENRPADYNGAVGRFSAQAKVDQSTVVAHQPLSLKLKFEGRGNAKLIDLPALSLPPSLEVYDTKNEAKFFKEGTSFKEFELILIPREPGPLTIAPFKVSAFDPTTGKFYSIATQPIALNVLPGVAPQSIASGNSNPTNPAKDQDKGPSLPSPSLEWEAGMGASLPFPKWLAWTFVYGLILAVLAWRLLSESGVIGRRRDFGKLVRSRLQAVEALVRRGDWRGVGVQGTNLVYLVLGEITGLGGAGQEFERLMAEAPPSVRRELQVPMRKLLSRLELLSFAPENLVGTAKDKAELKNLIRELETAVTKALRLGDESTDGEMKTEKA